jgi:hypothetical protein
MLDTEKFYKKIESYGEKRKRYSDANLTFSFNRKKYFFKR